MKTLSPQKLEALLKNRRSRLTLKLISWVLGFLVGALAIFTIMFLYRVLPHGGL